MGRHKHEVRKHFDEILKDGRKANRCKFCQKVLFGHAGSLQFHLKRCGKYLTASGADKDIDLSPADEYAGPSSPKSSQSSLSAECGQSSQSSGKSEHQNWNWDKKQERLKQSKISDYMDRPLSKQKQDLIDQILVKALVFNNIAFNVLESPSFRSLLSSLNSSYRIPSRLTASHPILNKLFFDYECMVRDRLNRVPFVSVATDSWKDEQQNTIVNIVACIRKPVVLRSIRVESTLTGDAYMKLIWDVCDEYCIKDKCVQIISDGGSNIVKARNDIAKEYPHVNSSYCVPHHLILMIGDVMKTNAFSQQIKLLIRLLVKIKYSAEVRKMCKDTAELKGWRFTKVSLPAPTRWIYYARVIQNVTEKKDVFMFLAQMRYFHKHLNATEGSEEAKQLDKMAEESFWDRLRVVSLILINKDVFLISLLISSSS